MKLHVSTLLLFFVAWIAGCGSTDHAVSGTVKFEGQPIADGHIAFIPAGSGAGGGGPITQGAYSIRVPAGKNKVEITASKKMPLPAGKKDMYGNSEETRSYIPAKYNSKSELAMDVSGPTKKDFDLDPK